MNVESKSELKRFYKYMPAETAKIVLITDTLRWSSPPLFNDPFDVARELAYNIELTEIAISIRKIQEESVANPTINISGYRDYIQYAINYSRALRRLDTDHKLNQLDQADSKQMFDQESQEVFDELRKVWRDIYIPNMRILCVSNRKDITPMWHHYADKYKGVVFELTLNYAFYNPWLDFRCVRYSDKPLELSTANGWAQLLLSPTEEMPQKIHDFHAYVKKLEWAYEKESRAIRFDTSPYNTESYTDYPISPMRISSIYFGPYINEEYAECLEFLNSHKTKPVPMYKMNFGLDQKMKFTKIPCK